jgi:hypothetical protein
MQLRLTVQDIAVTLALCDEHAAELTRIGWEPILAKLTDWGWRPLRSARP